MSPLGSPTTRGAALVVVWSSGFIGAELGARHAGATTVLAWRCVVTALVLLPWLVPAVRRMDLRAWGRQAVLALLCQALYLGGVFGAAAAGLPAGTSALIASLQPALVLVAGARGARTGWRPRHLVGLALGTAGVALTAAGDLRSGVAVVALLLPLGAMLALTGGTLLQQHWDQRTPLADTLAVQALVTALALAAYAVLTGGLAPPRTAGFWLAVGWAVAAGIGSYACYYLVTDRDGPARSSTLLYLTPAATALWAAPMFGQEVRPTTVLGLLVAGVAVGLLTDNRVPGRGPACHARAHGDRHRPDLVRRPRLGRPRERRDPRRLLGALLGRGPRRLPLARGR